MTNHYSVNSFRAQAADSLTSGSSEPGIQQALHKKLCHHFYKLTISSSKRTMTLAFDPLSGVKTGTQFSNLSAVFFLPQLYPLSKLFCVIPLTYQSVRQWESSGITCCVEFSLQGSVFLCRKITHRITGCFPLSPSQHYFSGFILSLDSLSTIVFSYIYIYIYILNQDHTFFKENLLQKQNCITNKRQFWDISRNLQSKDAGALNQRGSQLLLLPASNTLLLSPEDGFSEYLRCQGILNPLFWAQYFWMPQLPLT